MNRASPAILVALLAVSCAKNTDPTTPGYWIDRLGDRHEREDALTQLGQLGDKSAVPAVMKWFQTEGSWQPAAAYALGQLGDKSVTPKLIEALDYDVGAGTDRNTRLKHGINRDIIRALAMLSAQEAAPNIVRLLQSRDSAVREAAVRALGTLRNPVAREPLADLATKEPDPMLRSAAIGALGDLGDPQAASVLVPLLYIETPGLSFYGDAYAALVQLGESAAPILLTTLRRQNPAVEAVRLPGDQRLPDGVIEAKAASVLGSMHASSARDVVAATLEAQYKRLSKKNVDVAALRSIVIELIYAAGHLGGDTAVRVLETIVKDVNADLRLAATEALTTLGAVKSVPALFTAAKTGPMAARQDAIVAISRLGGPDDLTALDALATATKGGAPTTLAETVKAERVRLVVAKTCKKDTACWKQKLGDDNPKIRERAVYELGWLNAKDALDALIERLTGDSDGEVRMAAVLAIGALGGADPDQLQSIYDTWSDKPGNSGVNQELRALIARLRSQKRR
jgi:HEAT repeat protein